MKVGSILPVDDFCGTQFSTPNGGVLTVVGIVGKSGSHKKYALTCSICHNDLEMFPDYFEKTKGDLVRGSIPCGCSKSPQLNERQQILDINRILEKNPDFKNLKCIRNSGKKSGAATIFDIECSICNSDTEMFPAYFKGLKGDLVRGYIPCGCSVKPQLNERQQILDINRILEKNPDFKNLKCLQISDNKSGQQTKFQIECKICNSDSELFPEYFKSTRGNLVSGHIPCGCSKSPQLNEIQITIKINRICKEKNYKFIGFVGGSYINAHTKLILSCPIHGEWNTANYNMFTKENGTGCSGCAKSGYDKSKPGYLYIYKYKFKHLPVVYKFGITNRTPKKRSKEHIQFKEHLVEHQECVFKKKWEDGSIPDKIESLLCQKYKGVCDWLTSGNTETFNESDYQDVLNIINNFKEE